MILSMHKDTVVQMADLKFVVLESKSCGAQIIFNIEAKVFPGVQRETATPSNCPVCTREFGFSTTGGIDFLRQAYLAITNDNGKVSFRVKDSDALSSNQ